LARDEQACVYLQPPPNLKVDTALVWPLYGIQNTKENNHYGLEGRTYDKRMTNPLLNVEGITNFTKDTYNSCKHNNFKKQRGKDSVNLLGTYM
jgi:hypothetical protein